MINCILKPFSAAHLSVLAKEKWTYEEWLFWTGHRFSFPMQEKQFLDHLQEDSRSWWILKNEENIIGVGELQNLNNEIIKLSRIYIFKKYRKQSYSKVLIQLLMEKAQEKYGIHTFCLNVFEENKIAIHLYASLGFKEEEREIIAIEDRQWVLLKMRK